MKNLVRFTGFNAYDYYGHEIHIVDPDSANLAEYEVVLRDTDELVESDCGVVLKRDGVIYTQITKMNRFKGVSFIDDDGDVVSLKLIKIE